MGGGSAPGGGQVSSTTPWGPQQRYLKDIYSRAGQLSNVEMPFYPGQTVAPQSGATLAGEEMAMERAGRGPGVTGQAEDYYGDVLSGKFMGGNPYLDKMYSRAAGAVGEQFNRITMPTLEGRFARAGRTGGGAYEGAVRGAGGELAEKLAGMGERIYGEDYNRERGYMAGAAQAAPGAEAAGYMASDKLREVGAGQESYQQRLINSLIQRYEYGQTEPWQRLQRYSGAIGAPVMEQQSGPLNKGLAEAQSIMGMLGMFCWVAAEYEGWFTPNWWTTRSWIAYGWEGRTGDVFRFLYLRYGERVAPIVRRNKLVRAALRPLFAWCLRKGREMKE